MTCEQDLVRFQNRWSGLWSEKIFLYTSYKYFNKYKSCLQIIFFCCSGFNFININFLFHCLVWLTNLFSFWQIKKWNIKFLRCWILITSGREAPSYWDILMVICPFFVCEKMKTQNICICSGELNYGFANPLLIGFLFSLDFAPWRFTPSEMMLRRSYTCLMKMIALIENNYTSHLTLWLFIDQRLRNEFYLMVFIKIYEMTWWFTSRR